jgi:hypothetical protein
LRIIRLEVYLNDVEDLVQSDSRKHTAGICENWVALLNASEGRKNKTKMTQ